jgi:hypothetical protein
MRGDMYMRSPEDEYGLEEKKHISVRLPKFAAIFGFVMVY